MSASTRPEPPIEPGVVLAGRYRLVRLIGEGGMGSVWEARQLTTDKVVAIKLLKGSDNNEATRLLREARVAAGLTHRNIVQVFDFWGAESGGPVFMVMELIQGETLAQVLHRRGRLPAEETIAIALPIVSALRAAHAQSIVHRDLKPENVLLAQGTPDEPVEVKVVDFGLAKRTLSEAATVITQSGAIIGTPYYMAPEQIYGEKDLDPRVDVWALGAVLYECLAGVRAFPGENFGQVFRAISQAAFTPLREHAPAVPPALDALIARMLSHDRSQRPTMVEAYDGLLRPEARTPITRPLAAVPAATTQRLTPPPAAPVAHPSVAQAPAPAEQGAQNVTRMATANSVRRGIGDGKGVRRAPAIIVALTLLAAGVAAVFAMVLGTHPRPPVVNLGTIPAPQAEPSQAPAEPMVPVTLASIDAGLPSAVPGASPPPPAAAPVRALPRPRPTGTSDPLGGGRF